ncbi:hypothetical protein GCM10027347_12430 [Larkinella harenae]
MLFLITAFVTGNILSARAQSCYAPISGPGVEVTAFSSTTICVNSLCLGNSYTELQRVVDNSLETYANAGAIISALGTTLNAQGISVRNNSVDYPANHVTGFVLSRAGVTNLSVLNDLTMKTYLNGAPTSQAAVQVGALLSGALLGSEEKLYATFIATQPFDEIRLNTSTLNATVLGNLRVYGAVAFPQNCNLENNAVCDDYINGIGTEVIYNGAFTCAACSLTDQNRLVDSDKNNYALLTPTAGVLSTVSAGVLDTRNYYPAGSRAGFIISPNNANTILSASVLNTITIETYLYGVKKEERTLSSTGTNLLGLSLLRGSGSILKQKLGFVTSQDFNEVRLRINQPANVNVGSIRVYGAFEEPANCTNCETLLNENGTGKYKWSLVTGDQWTGLYGTLALFSALENPERVVNTTTNDYATYNTGVSVGAGARVTVANDGTTFPSTSFVAFRISKENSLIDADLLNSITIRAYNGTTLVGTSDANTLLDLTLISGSTNRTTVGFYPPGNFNRLQISIGSVAGLLGEYRIHDVYIVEDTDGDGVPDCNDSCVTGGSALDFDGDGLTDDCDPDDDNDGIPDTVENPSGDPNRDTDGDGNPDLRDLDSDNDGILDSVERGPDGNNPINSDSDSKPDYIDLDSDNDGINDVIEGGGVDTDNNGRADGSVDSRTGVPATAGNGLIPPNTDGDGNPDYRDLDSDGDGIFDLYESGITNPGSLDSNKDGVVDAADGGDNDGIPQTVDGAPDSFGDANSPALPNTDGDPVPNYRDLDSDNDGIPDAVERGPDGTNPTQSDPDGIPDYMDLDSDNDGINDVVEAGGTDADNNGIADGPPADGSNGIPTSAGNGLTPGDADNDGTPNYRDLDSDNDGVKDLYESGIPNPGSLDANNDGVVDAADGDDRDGIPQTVDGAPNTYGDSNSPPLPDTDNDGNPDYTDPGVDLYPTLSMPDRLYPATGGTKNLTLNVFNLTAGSVTDGTITVRITKPTAAYTIALTGSAGDEWTLSSDQFSFTLTSKPGVTINGGSSKPITMSLTIASTAAKGTANLNFSIVAGSGGETNSSNNVASAVITNE